jgi:hypothetical protein
MIMTANLSKGLQHVLDVYKRVRTLHLSRIKAVHECARIRRVDPQTIISACTRSLGITAVDLDEFLIPKNSEAFCDYLVKRFPPYQKDIEEFFRAFDQKAPVTTEEPGKIIRTLFPDERKDIARRLLLDSILKKLSVWTGRQDVPEDIRQEIANMKNQIEKVKQYI